MGDWKSLLNGDPIDWLLEGSNPSVRYFTLRWLFDLPEGDAEVASAAQAITQSAPAVSRPRRDLKRDRIYTLAMRHIF